MDTNGTPFEVQLDFMKILSDRRLQAPELNQSLSHFLEMLVPNFQGHKAIPSFVKEIKIVVQLQHNNSHLRQCCLERHNKQVSPGTTYKVVDNDITMDQSDKSKTNRKAKSKLNRTHNKQELKNDDDDVDNSHKDTNKNKKQNKNRNKNKSKNQNKNKEKNNDKMKNKQNKDNEQNKNDDFKSDEKNNENENGNDSVDIDKYAKEFGKILTEIESKLDDNEITNKNKMKSICKHYFSLDKKATKIPQFVNQIGKISKSKRVCIIK